MSANQISFIKSSRLRLFLLIVAIAGIATCVYAVRPGSAQKPVLIGSAHATPAAIQFHNGSWYWLEHTKREARLLRAAGSGVQVVATADTINSYGVDDHNVVWIGRHGIHWAVVVSPVGGGTDRSVWTGDAEMFGVCVSAGRIYWLDRLPAPTGKGDPFPTLSAALELRSIAFDGGAVTSLARLWESEDGRVLGIHGGVVYVAAYRHTLPGNICIYRVGVSGTPPVRVAAESECPPALLTTGGSLYWIAPSSEARGSYCLRRLDRHGHVETLSDWLPVNGALYEAARGVVYGDREARQALWSAGPHDVFPEVIAVPDGYYGLAVGEHEMLLTKADTSIANPTLYRMPLP